MVFPRPKSAAICGSPNTVAKSAPALCEREHGRKPKGQSRIRTASEGDPGSYKYKAKRRNDREVHGLGKFSIGHMTVGRACARLTVVAAWAATVNFRRIRHAPHIGGPRLGN